MFKKVFEGFRASHLNGGGSIKRANAFPGQARVSALQLGLGKRKSFLILLLKMPRGSKRTELSNERSCEFCSVIERL